MSHFILESPFVKQYLPACEYKCSLQVVADFDFHGLRSLEADRREMLNAPQNPIQVLRDHLLHYGAALILDQARKLLYLPEEAEAV